MAMNRLQSAIATTVACACLTGFVAWGTDGVSAQAAPQAPASQPAGPKLNPEEILAAQTKDEKGGDAAAGRPLFEKQCANCHRFGGIGKDVGPDLTTITSRFKKSDVLESILWPSKVISDQYQAEMIELTNGKVVTGVLVRESAAAVLIRTGESPDKPIAVPKAQIANRTPSTVSLMPEGLLDGLTHEQIANLLAFMLAPPPVK
jgi:putative heme-binding domain-containing protein